MHIDQSHRPWQLAALVIFGVCLVGYVPYALASRPSGGSVPGLIYGVAGYGIMLFEGLLGVRKKVPVWRLGRAKNWMRGHIWFGLLTLPIILFHSGFSFRGPLTLLLMVLLFLVYLSGLTGAAIQHFMPGIITSTVPLETIYEQIPRVRGQLSGEADHLTQVLFTLPGAILEPAAVAGSAGLERHSPGSESREMIEMESQEREYAEGVYRDLIVPFLRNPDDRRSVLADSDQARILFEAFRRRLPEVARGVIADLENICEETRQLTRQKRLYVWLHGWLLVHVPLSVALIVLGGVHAIAALRY
jgi:hypothetical protein